MQIIKGMPVHMEMEDVVGWHFEPKGSVKSAYRVHRDVEARKAQRGGNVQQAEVKREIISGPNCGSWIASQKSNIFCGD